MALEEEAGAADSEVILLNRTDFFLILKFKSGGFDMTWMNWSLWLSGIEIRAIISSDSVGSEVPGGGNILIVLAGEGNVEVVEYGLLVSFAVKLNVVDELKATASSLVSLVWLLSVEVVGLFPEKSDVSGISASWPWIEDDKGKDPMIGSTTWRSECRLGSVLDDMEE
jgi:hypothetical protein